MSKPDLEHLYLVGFGSQARAWAYGLLKSNRKVSIVLRNSASASWKQACELGYAPLLLDNLSLELEKTEQTQAHIAFLCNDSAIASIYNDYFTSIHKPLHFILAHGYAIYSGQLKIKNPHHELSLFAPKVIGPKLEQAIAKSKLHKFVAAVHCKENVYPLISELALCLGFQEQNIVRTSFENETIGDLISEQGLLCGGFFTLLQWTLDAMRKAKVPERLIEEECYREMAFIAELVEKNGPAKTLTQISNAAKAGTILMNERFEASNLKILFEQQIETIVNKDFVKSFENNSWEEKLKTFSEKLGGPHE